MGSGDEVLDGVWRFTAIHPEWEDDDGWEPEVAWWAVRTEPGLLLIDPLVEEWDELDGLIARHGGCSGILRTCFWHQRTIAEAAGRYAAEVWAKPPPADVPPRPFDQAVSNEARLPGGAVAVDVIRDDEIALRLPEQRALLFGDVFLRDRDGTLTMCPESWVARDGGHPRLREALRPLLGVEAEHVLVSHGPLVLGDGAASLARAVEPEAPPA